MGRCGYLCKQIVGTLAKLLALSAAKDKYPFEAKPNEARDLVWVSRRTAGGEYMFPALRVGLSDNPHEI